MTGVLEEREESPEALLSEDEIPMCESALDDEEDLDKDSGDGDSLLAGSGVGDKTDSAPVSFRVNDPRLTLDTAFFSCGIVFVVSAGFVPIPRN